MSRRYLACLLLLTLRAAAQEPATGAKIRTLQLLNDSVRGAPRQAAADLARRARLLRELMAENPKAAVSLLLPDSELRSLRLAVPAAAADLEESFAYTGPATVSMLDDFDGGQAVVLYEAALDGIGPVSAYGAAADIPAARCGEDVRLAGWRAGDRAVLTAATIIHNATALVCAPTGDQRAAVILLYGPGVDTPPVPPDVVADNLFGDHPDSATQQLLRSSYGKLHLSGTVFGWHKLSRTYDCSTETGALRSDAIAAAGSALDFAQFQRLFIFMHTSLRKGTCAWGGLGNIGCPTANPVDSTQRTSTHWIWMGSSTPVRTAIHEFGHNLGIGHSRSVQFPHDALEPDRSRAYYVEYGDPIAVMGSGAGEYTASHKQTLGWLGAGEILQVENDGTFLLTPLQLQQAGVKAIRIRRRPGQDEWLWLEYREPANDYGYAFGAGPTYARIMLRWQTPTTGLYSEILAATFDDPSPTHFEMAPGSVWHDVHGSLTVALGNATSDGVPVSVSYDAPCASISLPAGALTAAQAGQQIAVPVNAAPTCVWSAATNSVWLDAQPYGAQAGPGSLTITASQNPNPQGRASSVTIGRQPVFVQQAGTLPVGPAVTYTYPKDAPINDRDVFYNEIGYVPPGQARITEIDLIYNTTATEAGGCSFRYDLAARQYRMADTDGAYSAAIAANIFRNGKRCSGGSFVTGTRSSGEAYVNFATILKLSQPTLFVRFLSDDGKTSAWQSAASFNSTTECYIGFAAARLDPGVAGGNFNVFVVDSSRCPWTLTTDASWIRIGTASGSASGNVIVTVEANPGITARSATLSVGAVRIPVRQNGVTAAYYPGEIDAPAAAGSQSLLVVTTPHNNPPQFVSDSAWLVVRSVTESPLGGPGNAPAWQLALGLAENTDAAPRTATISCGGTSILIRQAGGSLRVAPMSELLSSTGGSGVLTVATSSPDQSWTAASSAGWIQIVSGAGTGNGAVSYTVSPNASGQSRTGYIAIGTLAVTLTQTRAGVSLAPAYTVKPVAGVSPDGFGGPASKMRLDRPGGLVFDSQGNLYIADRNRRMVVRVAPDGTATRFAGSGFCCAQAGSADALTADFRNPDYLAIDAADNLYIADTSLNRVFRVDPQGVLTTVAGNGDFRYSGDKASATAAGLYPTAVAVDSAGNLLIADSVNHRVRRVDSSGIITTIAGTGTAGYNGDNQPAASAQVNAPGGIAVDAAGILLLDTNNYRLRRIASDGTIGTIAGNGRNGDTGDRGPAGQAGLGSPIDVKTDANGNIFVAEYTNRIRRIRPDGTIETIAGAGVYGVNGDEGPALSAQLSLPYRLASDASGNLYFSELYASGVRQVSPDQVMHRYAGLPDRPSTGTAPQLRLLDPRGVTEDQAGNLYIAEGEGRRIYRIAPDGTAAHFAGSGLCCTTAANAPVANAAFSSIRDILALPDGSLLVVDPGQAKVLIIQNGVVTTFAGSGTAGYTGDGGPAGSARLRSPNSVAADPAGNVCIADTGNHAVRCVDAGGQIRTIAGNGASGFTGDGGTADRAQLFNPSTIRFDAAGNLYIAESQRIRRIGTDRIVQTIFLGTYSAFDLDSSGALVVYDGSVPILSGLSSLAGKTLLAGSQMGVTEAETDARGARFYNPANIRAGSGRIYVVDNLADRVYVLTPR